MKPRLIQKQKNPITLRQHHERRNKIFLRRCAGGFGDILMQRMMFEDFKNSFPEAELTFGCPYKFFGAAQNHPYATTVILGDQVDEQKFGIVYDITTACRVHETRFGPLNTKHRSDIWANHCGLELTHHEMYLEIDQDILQRCQDVLNYYNTSKAPTVLLATQSTTEEFGIGKSLTTSQIEGVVSNLREQGFFPFTVHIEKQAVYDSLGVNQFVNLRFQDWAAYTQLADYVISIDSANFHLAGGLKRPLVGIFSFTDGKVYGKYFDFVLVQKHRDNGNWPCGPCFNLTLCPKCTTNPKPCITELTVAEIMAGFQQAKEKWPL